MSFSLYQIPYGHWIVSNKTLKIFSLKLINQINVDFFSIYISWSNFEFKISDKAFLISAPREIDLSSSLDMHVLSSEYQDLEVILKGKMDDNRIVYPLIKKGNFFV